MDLLKIKWKDFHLNVQRIHAYEYKDAVCMQLFISSWTVASISCIEHGSAVADKPARCVTANVLQDGRSLTDTATCDVRRSNSSFVDRCFAAAGPRLWDTLPIHLRHRDSLGQFKRLLKTYLFGGWDRGALWHLLGAPCINHLTYLLMDTWRRYWCLTSFLSIVDACISCEDIAREKVAIFGVIFASCTFSEPRAAHFRHIF